MNLKKVEVAIAQTHLQLTRKIDTVLGMLRENLKTDLQKNLSALMVDLSRQQTQEVSEEESKEAKS